MKINDDFYNKHNKNLKEAKREIYNLIIQEKEYKELLEKPFFKFLFSKLLENFNKKEFKDDFHRINYLKKPFKNWKEGKLEQDNNLWKKLNDEQEKFKIKKFIKEIKNNSSKKSFYDYYSNINTMIKIETDGIDNCDEKHRWKSYSVKFIENYVAPSLANNDFLDLLLGQNKSFDNKEKLETYVYSSDKTSNPLNLEQLIALKNSHIKRVFNIQGPPGTGKTSLLKDLVSSLYLNKKRIWIASSNNAAVDNVLNSFNVDEILKNLPMIRLGKQIIVQKTYESLIKDFQPKKYDKVDKGSQKLVDVSSEIFEIERLLKEKETRKNSIYFFKDLISLSNEFKEIFKNDNPIDLANKLQLKFDKLRKLIIKNNFLKHKKNHWCRFVNFIRNWRWNNFLNKIKKINITPFVIKFSNSKIKICNEILGFYSFVCSISKYINRKDIDKQISDIKEKIIATTESTHNAIKSKNNKHWKIINAQMDNVNKKVEESSTFQNIVVGQFLFDNKTIYELFPIVFATTMSIPKLFKEGEKIDYLIIDEAAQTTIHSVLAVLKFFKNIIFLGDTSQLSAVVPLNPKAEIEVYEKTTLPEAYRNIKNSFPQIIERTLPKNISIMLKEHWRCTPQIANFFNDKYYKSQLKIMRNDLANKEKSIRYTKYNEEKFSDIILKIEEEYNDKLKGRPQKIALISPFQDVYKIKTNIETKGTTHKFQGLEIDTVIYYIKNEEFKKFNVNSFLDSSRLINVALSRAKNFFHLYIGDKALKSLKSSRNGNNHEIMQLINYIKAVNDEKSNINKWKTELEIIIDNSDDLILNNNSFLSQLNKELFDIIQNNNLFLSLGVRDIDINPNIKRIKDSKTIYDFVTFDAEGDVILVINKNQIIFKSNKIDVKTKYDQNIKFEKAKKIMTDRESFWWQVIRKKLNAESKKTSWYIMPNISISKILKINYSENKMHFDFVFTKFYFNKKTNSYYFNYLFFMELDDATHNLKESASRDQIKNKLCAKNNLNLIRLKI